MTAPLGRNGLGRYRIRKGGKHEAPGVTSIVGLLDKPGLSWGAAKETALFAIHHQDEWIDKSEDEAYERLRKHHRGVWTAKADVGNIVHDVALEWSQGNNVDVIEKIKIDDKGRGRRWTGGDAEPYRRTMGCLDALERFYEEKQPKWLQTEQTVIHNGDSPDHNDIDPNLCFAGSFDATAELNDGSTWRLDWKTGSRYPIETTLQLAAYEYAQWIGVYGPDGDVVNIIPNQRTEKQGVVYLHDDGTYELLQLPVNETAFERFMELRKTKDWLSDMEKWVKAHPEPQNDSTKEEQ